MDLAEAILSGDRLALSRLLSQIENNTSSGRSALNKLFPHTGKAHLIGVTGAPGTGKSSLVNRLAYHYRHPPEGEPQRRVAVIAVDPTSPFTGGAILGDRIRMRDLVGDPGIFIRSMASRGALGGLAHTTSGLVQAFDASGYEIIFIETVGAGQVEVDIARLAHTTLVVDAPGLGDDVQAIKAGILEIADILVVNKADRPGADQTLRALRSMLQLAHPAPRIFRHHGRLMMTEPWGDRAVEDHSLVKDAPETIASPTESWIPPLQSTVAIEGTGIRQLVEEISRHHHYLSRTGEWQRRERARLGAELDSLLQEALVARWRDAFREAAYQEILDRLVRRQFSPYQAVHALLDGEVTDDIR
jgi:LAO/AO transport system kinase